MVEFNSTDLIKNLFFINVNKIYAEKCIHSLL